MNYAEEKGQIYNIEGVENDIIKSSSSSMTTKEKRDKERNIWIGVGAAVLVLLSVGGYFFFNNSSKAVAPDMGERYNQRIFYEETKDAITNIFSVDPDGEDLKQLTHTDPGYKKKISFEMNAVSPDGHSIAYKRDDKDVDDAYIMNEKGELIKSLEQNVDSFTIKAFSRDGKLIVVLLDNGSVRIIDLESKKTFPDIRVIHNGSFFACENLQFTSDGASLFISGTADYLKKAFIVAISDGNIEAELPTPNLSAPENISLSSNDRRIVYTNSSDELCISSWDGSELNVLKKGSITRPQFSRDGRKILYRQLIEDVDTLFVHPLNKKMTAFEGEGVVVAAGPKIGLFCW